MYPLYKTVRYIKGAACYGIIYVAAAPPAEAGAAAVFGGYQAEGRSPCWSIILTVINLICAVVSNL